MPIKSTKARAWVLAADILEAKLGIDHCGQSSPESPPFDPVMQHLRDSVIPSLRRRAAIIERNAK